VVKDGYSFDFLELGEDYSEKELERLSHYYYIAFVVFPVFSVVSDGCVAF
jgi:predicted nuclease of restriction endonuclease-like (RecB) superfamily